MILLVDKLWSFYSLTNQHSWQLVFIRMCILSWGTTNNILSFFCKQRRLDVIPRNYIQSVTISVDHDLVRSFEHKWPDRISNIHSSPWGYRGGWPYANVKDPCTICGCQVQEKEEAVECDTCALQTHRRHIKDLINLQMYCKSVSNDQHPTHM
mgnify:CR=1 FL=1